MEKTTLLSESIAVRVKELFETRLKNPVEVLFFGSEKNYGQCDDTRQLVEEVTALSDRLTLSIHDLEQESELASQYNLTMVPGLVIAAREGDQIVDYGIRFAGIPSGHEFTSLIQDLILVSERDSGLSVETREFLSKLQKPVHLQVFVTPT